MPFTEINLGDQHSQKMQIKYIRDNYLVCTMRTYSTYIKANPPIDQTRSVDVSRPIGLRRMDSDPLTYSYIDINTRKVISGANINLNEIVTPPYKVGDEIYVTKLIADPADTSFDQYTTNLSLNSTVDLFVDENRAGRSWVVSGSGQNGGITGYDPKCVVFCEDGEEVSGQILFKSGCSDTIEGEIDAASNLDPNEIAVSGGFTTYLYYGPKSTNLFTDENEDNVSLNTYSGDGSPIQGFTNQPNTNDTSFPLSYYHLSDFYYDSDTKDNFVAIKLPSGTSVKATRIGRCTYSLPEVGENVEAFGTNTFSNGTYYYLFANNSTDECFGCGSYWIGIKGDGSTNVGEVMSTGWVKGSEKCSEISVTADTALASTGDMILNLGCGGSDVNKKINSILIGGAGMSFTTGLASSVAVGNTNDYPNMIASLPSGADTVVDICNHFKSKNGSASLASNRNFRILFESGTVQQKILGYEGTSPIYAWIPSVGTTGRLKFEEKGGAFAGNPSSTEKVIPCKIQDNKYYAFSSISYGENGSCPDSSWDMPVGTSALGVSRNFYLKLSHVGWRNYNDSTTDWTGYYELVKVIGMGTCPE